MIEIAQTSLIAAGLVLPGWGWARRWHEGVLVAMVLSWLAIFGWTLLATVALIPLSAGYLIVGQTLFGVMGWLLARRSGVVQWGVQWDLKLGVGWAVLPLVAVAIWKALAQPLSGVDVDFRWNHLAEMMVKTGGLQFYPPTTAEDFAVYFWADGIPPLVSSIYAWGYLVAGETDRVWTAIPVLLQWSGILMVLKKLGDLCGGKDSGNGALLVGGSTFLLQFTVNLGQETGYTALGVGLMVYGIVQSRGNGGGPPAWLAGAGAALVASSREYGWAIVVAGFAVHAGMNWKAGKGWRHLGGWLLLVLPAIWYLRTWVIAGNPWLSLSMGGLFPVNPILANGWRVTGQFNGESLQTAAGWWEIGRLILLTAAPALAGWIAGAFWLRRRPGWSAGVAVGAATIAVWLLSVSYTAGGIFYSMRVLSPLLLLGSAWGGVILAHKVESRCLRAVVAVVLSAWTIDASARALTAVANPWTTPLREWSSVGYDWQHDFWREQEVFFEEIVAVIPGCNGILPVKIETTCRGGAPKFASCFRRIRRAIRSMGCAPGASITSCFTAPIFLTISWSEPVCCRGSMVVSAR